MDEKDFDTPLSQSGVTTKLELIQKRCSELLDDPDAMLELAIDDPESEGSYAGDPYNHLS
jgi:hypothetical protein